MLNTGTGFDKGKTWIEDLGDDWKNRPQHGNGEHTMLIDMNGDKLPDKVFDRNPYNNYQGLYVMLNTGTGFDKGKTWIENLYDDWKNRPQHSNGEHAMLIDMNGDNLPDKVFDRNPYNNKHGFYVMLNTGSDFDKGKTWIEDLGDDWKNRPQHSNGEYTMLIDINGDNLPDKVFDRNPYNN